MPKCKTGCFFCNQMHFCVNCVFLYSMTGQPLLHDQACLWVGNRVYFSRPTFLILPEISLDPGVPPLLKYTLMGITKNNSLNWMAAKLAHDALQKAYDLCLMVPLRGLSREPRRRWVVRRLATKKTGGLLSNPSLVQ